MCRKYSVLQPVGLTLRQAGAKLSEGGPGCLCQIGITLLLNLAQTQDQRLQLCGSKSERWQSRILNQGEPKSCGPVDHGTQSPKRIDIAVNGPTRNAKIPCELLRCHWWWQLAQGLHQTKEAFCLGHLLSVPSPNDKICQ